MQLRHQGRRPHRQGQRDRETLLHGSYESDPRSRVVAGPEPKSTPFLIRISGEPPCHAALAAGGCVVACFLVVQLAVVLLPRQHHYRTTPGNERVVEQEGTKQASPNSVRRLLNGAEWL